MVIFMVINKEYVTKDTEKVVYFNPKSMNFKEKVVWTIKLWFGFETNIKIKYKKEWY